MNTSNLNRLALAMLAGAALAFASIPAQAQPRPGMPSQQDDKGDQSDKEKKDKKDAEDRQKAARELAAQQQAGRERAAQQLQDARSRTATPVAGARPGSRAVEAHDRNADRRQEPARSLPPQAAAPAQANAFQRGVSAQHSLVQAVRLQRLTDQQQQARIQQQQQSQLIYRQNLANRQVLTQQNNLLLQQQQRNSQYRTQLQYYDRLRQQQLGYQNDRYDYNNDPYYYTASRYRYYRAGRYYDTNQYGVNSLRQALNYGYQEGYRAGVADQQDHWRYSYRESFVYQDANYGYNGRYVQQDDYNHYFREGFQRGYEDGYYGRRTYGYHSNGSDSLLGVVLTTILNLQSVR